MLALIPLFFLTAQPYSRARPGGGGHLHVRKMLPFVATSVPIAYWGLGRKYD